MNNSSTPQFLRVQLNLGQDGGFDFITTMTKEEILAEIDRALEDRFKFGLVKMNDSEPPIPLIQTFAHITPSDPDLSECVFDPTKFTGMVLIKVTPKQESRIAAPTLSRR